MHPQVEEIREEVRAASERLHGLADAVPASSWSRRPGPDSWSVAECVQHLNLTSASFVPRLWAAVEEARALHRPAPRRYRRDPIGWLLWRIMPPPVRMRTKTSPSFVPGADVDPAGLIREFDRLQAEQIAILDSADRLPLSRVRIESPFDPRVRYNSSPRSASCRATSTGTCGRPSGRSPNSVSRTDDACLASGKGSAIAPDRFLSDPPWSTSLSNSASSMSPGSEGAPPMGRRTGAAGVRLRAMREADLDRVIAIFEDGIAAGDATFETLAPDRPSWDAAHLPHSRLVAEAGGLVVGWAALGPTSARTVYAGVAEVSVYVDADARGRGFGTGLLQGLIAASERNGIWTLQAGIFPENESSLRLHTRCGFRVVGVRERLGAMRGWWRDVVLLERRSRIVGVE